MKKRVLSIFLVLTMMLALIPTMSITASAEEAGSRGNGEVITFNDGKTAFSPHFILTTGHYGDKGWYAGMDGDPIVIETLSENIVITAIDAVVSKGGEYYSSTGYNSGKKVEDGSVENGSTVHVRNIYTNRLEINNYSGIYFAISKVTVYYTEICGSEVIFSNESNYAESEHFTITTRDAYIGGWYPGAFDDPVIIEAKTDNIVITAIEALIDDGAEFYDAAEYSSGEKVETGAVESGSTVHVNNIFSKRLEINSHGREYFEFDQIMVYYTEKDDCEILTYNGSRAELGTNFLLYSGHDCDEGWYVGMDGDPLVIDPISEDYVITAIEAVVRDGGEHYYAADYSSGEKVETGSVENGTTVHVKNIYANQLMFTTPSGSEFVLDQVTVYYTHVHNFTDTAKDNGNGTHSFKCKLCDEYGWALDHAWDDGKITTPATDTSEGVVAYTCTECGATSTKTVPKVIPYTYYTADGIRHDDGNCTDYTIVDETTTNFESGRWYVVNSDVTINSRITVDGTANLILCDGYTLNAAKGIDVPEDTTLNIYSQKTDTGELLAAGDNQAAAIGSRMTANGGTVNIYGGIVTALSESGAGIGGGATVDGGAVAIYGGHVTASSVSGAGIGAGLYNDSHGTLTLGQGVTFNAGNDADNISVSGNNDNAADALGKHYFVSHAAKDPVSYVYYTPDGETAEKHVDGVCNDYEFVTRKTDTFENGKWYVVSGNVTVSERIAVSGTANLILCDGATLNAEKGISVRKNNTFTIYGQSEGTGKLIANGDEYRSGIGSDSKERELKSGIINIHGGEIEATGAKFAAGIGGGWCEEAVEINIFGGKITAVGGMNAAGIGGGDSADCEIIRIYGGNITACGTERGTGIGSGSFSNGTVTINGGTVTATSEDGAGIGGGGGRLFDNTVTVGTVTINGGTVTALSINGAGIGGGDKGNGIVTVNGGAVTATSEYGSAVGNGSLCEVESTLTLGDGVIFGAGNDADNITVTGDKNNASDAFGQLYFVTPYAGHIHDFTGDYKDNGDGTHSRKCNGCDEYGTTVAHNFTDDECVCGAKVFEFVSKNLALDSALAFKFYGYLNDPNPAEDAYVEFKIGDSRTANVALNDAATDSKGRYVFTCYLNELEVDEQIDAIFHDGEYSVERQNPLSVTDYLDKVLDNHKNGTDEDEKIVNLVNAISNYAHYAQLALDETHTEYTVGEGGAYHGTAARTDITLHTADDLVQFAAVKKVADGFTAVKSTSRSLVLDDETAIVLYITPASADYVPTVKVTDKDGNAVNFTCDLQESGKYKVVIRGIAAHMLADAYTVDIDEGSLTYTNLSALSYAYSILSSSKSEAYRNAVSALYDYYTATVDYMN